MLDLAFLPKEIVDESTNRSQMSERKYSVLTADKNISLLV